MTTITGRVFDAAQEAAFAATLPSQLRQWAPQLIKVGREYNLDPYVLAGIMYRESLGGQALSPPGPAGTGDFTPRNWGPSPMPPDYKPGPPKTGGWGRGLMQIDYNQHNAWVVSNPWWDPLVNIRKAASILQDNLRYFSSKPSTPTVTLDAAAAQKRGVAPGTYRDPRPLSGDLLATAAVAAYNGGQLHVLRSIAAGVDPSVTTTGGEYGTSVLARAISWSNKLVT